MKLAKQEVDFILRNELMIIQILEKRINDLKDRILDVPKEEREGYINWLKEYKESLGLIKEITAGEPVNNFTGI